MEQDHNCTLAMGHQYPRTDFTEKWRPRDDHDASGPLTPCTVRVLHVRKRQLLYKSKTPRTLCLCIRHVFHYEKIAQRSPDLGGWPFVGISLLPFRDLSIHPLRDSRQSKPPVCLRLVGCRSLHRGELSSFGNTPAERLVSAAMLSSASTIIR